MKSDVSEPEVGVGVGDASTMDDVVDAGASLIVDADEAGGAEEEGGVS